MAMTTAMIIQEICTHYDEKVQKLVACEELGELIQQISKSVREGKDYDVQRMIEEIADVYIIIYELTWMHNIDGSDIQQMIYTKLTRQLKRIEDERRNDN